MKDNKSIRFLECFPNKKFRYIDQTGAGRAPISSDKLIPKLNEEGYESYFTVNGFNSAYDNKKEQCTNLNAFFVDIDGRKSEEELDNIKKMLDPSFIIETKNGYHIYWLLDEEIYKDEVTEKEWNDAVDKWEKIEQSIVTKLNADPVVKDITRILRVPGTYYWKKSGDEWMSGVANAPFKIKGIYKSVANAYTMDMIAEVFPPAISTLSFSSQKVTDPNLQRFANAERVDFFSRVNNVFPIEERDSFKKLISGKPGTIPEGFGRNNALVVTASLMKQAGWSIDRAVEHVSNNGWHGMENDRGGGREIVNTINSAYANNYTYSYKNELISYNMSPEEQLRIQDAFNSALKDKREKNVLRYATYEREILNRHPYLRKNEIGIIFNYNDGVYKMLTDQEVSDIILNAMYDDMLWSFRNKKGVADKTACLLSIIPNLNLTNDKGHILNLKNGLLNVTTRELLPHTPNFVSLIQFPVEYNPVAECPVWLRCVDDWMAGDESENKKRLLQQFSGYCLTSSMYYDKALFLVGDGGNGKSTFVDTIARIIGHDATSHIDLESLYGQYGMHGLIGKRLNIIEEVHGNYYQSNKLKKLISGELVTIDIKYKPQFTFRPQAKFIFAVNMMPRVDDTSTATERRICAVQFKNNFRNNPNTQLRSDLGLLAQELSGILNWMLDGADDLAKNKGFVITEEQTRMLDEYRQENSSVEGFIAECLEFDPEEEMKARTLYEYYKQWCQRDGRKFKSNIAFTKEMKAFGVKTGSFSFKERENGRNGSRYCGVKMCEDTGLIMDLGNIDGF